MLFKFCNSLLNFKYNMLGDGSATQGNAEEFEKTVLPIITDVTTALLAIVAAIATIWAIWCAIKMFTADNAEKKDAAKKRVIYTVVAVVVTVMLIIILQFVKAKIPDWIGGRFQTQ